MAATLPLDDSLPATWQPLRPVQAVNMDGDAALEYLLFFTYDGVSGPVGAVIYDNRLGDRIVVDGEESSRPAASLMPYPILPSYRADGGRGFIAEPEQKDAIAVYPINIGATDRGDTTAAANDSETTATSAAQTDLLVILGGTTYVTFVWWQPTDDSYGVRQLYTPHRFETEKFQPFPWESWREAPRLIEEIIAVYPLHDRNLLCSRRRYTLVAPDLETFEANQPIDTIAYRETNMGLDFCSGIPTAPFYPEAIVLAYLSGNRSSLLDPAIEDAARQEIQAVAMPQEIVYVNDLASYKTVYSAAAENNGVQVCAEVLRPGAFFLTNERTVAADEQGNAISFVSTAPDSAPPYALQWLLFTLHYEPFRLEPPPAQPERLFITKVSVVPVPNRTTPIECRAQLGDHSP